MGFIDPWNRPTPISPDIADILVPGAPVGAPGVVTPDMYPTTPVVLDGINLISGGFISTPSDPIDEHAHLPHAGRGRAAEKRYEAHQAREYADNADEAVRIKFNQIYLKLRNRPGARQELLTELAGLYGSDAYRDSSYFQRGIPGNPTTDETIAILAANTLEAWTTSLDSEIGMYQVRISQAGNGKTWKEIIDDYGVLNIGDGDDPYNPTGASTVIGEDDATVQVPMGDATQFNLEKLLDDPRFFAELWNKAQGIPPTGRTIYQDWLAKQWRIPAINYALIQDPLIGDLSEEEAAGLSYWDYLMSIENQPVGDIRQDLVQKYSELDRTGQLSALGRFSTVQGLDNLEQMLYRSTLSGQGIPDWLASNLASQKYAGQAQYEISPRGLDPSSPSFFNTLVGGNPLALGGDPLAYGIGGSGPIGSTTALGGIFGEYTEEPLLDPQLVLALEEANNPGSFGSQLQAILGKGVI